MFVSIVIKIDYQLNIVILLLFDL